MIPGTTLGTFVDNVDRDHTEQNVQGDQKKKKNETHEHVNKSFNFQAIATKHHTFHLNLMHGLHTKFH